MHLNKSEHCLNCDTQVGEHNYCPACGQLNTDRHITMRQILRDFFSDYLTFDSRFFRSIYPLMLQPGKLTTEYLAGRRSKYILPIRVYIFSTLLFFSLMGVSNLFSDDVDVEPDEDPFLSRDTLAKVFAEYESVIPLEVRDTLITRLDTLFTIKERDTGGINMVIDDGAEDYAFGRFLVKRARYLQEMGSAGSDMFTSEMLNQLPKVLFLMLPVFGLIMKLLYVRRKFFYLEHLVFALHYHAFMFILLLPSQLWYNEWSLLVVFLALQVYLFMAMRRVYGQSRRKTFVKFAILQTLYTTAVIPALLVLLVLTIAAI